jgi:hypothetical protein
MANMAEEKVGVEPSLKMNQVRLRPTLIVVAAIFAFLAGVLWNEYRNHQSLLLPDGLKSRGEFEKWASNKEVIFVGLCRVDSQTVSVIGLKQLMLFACSGPPVYLFDPSGKLVDWTTDVGDGRSEILGADYDLGGMPPGELEMRTNVIYVTERFETSK